MDPEQTNPAGGSYSVMNAIGKSDAVRKLYERRSRRVTFSTQLDGPLPHEDLRKKGTTRPPAPITKEEEAYLVAAAVGITGPVRADLPYTDGGGGRTIMNLYGRTIASPDAAHTQRLIVINDAGSWLIKAPQDFEPEELPDLVQLVRSGTREDLCRWYDRMRVRISVRRAEIPRKVPYQAAFNFGSTNLPGTTYFLPITDLSAFCLNVLFSGFEKNAGVVLHDLRNNPLAPAGIAKKSLRPTGPLNGLDSEMQGTIEHLSELIRGWTGNERGQMFANLARAAQELNLDGFPHAGGQLRAWAEELDFQLLRVPYAKLSRGPSRLRYAAASLFLHPTPYSWITWLVPSWRRKLKRHVEVPLALEVDGKPLIQPYCPPFYPSMTEAVQKFAENKFAALYDQLEKAALFDQVDGVGRLGPEQTKAVKKALKEYTVDEVERVARFAQYCWDRYGVFPYCGEPGPLGSLEAFQVHVADPEYYEHNYRTRLTDDQKARATQRISDGTDVGNVGEAGDEREPVDAPPQDTERSGSPPWELEADHILLLYDVPKERFSSVHLPHGFDLVTNRAGMAELLVGFNHIGELRTTKDDTWVSPYDEIMVSVRVHHRANKSEGSYYLKLHLDQRVPLEMGIVHVGYPKVPAHIQRYEGEGRIRYAAQQLDNQDLYQLEVEPRIRFGERLRALAIWALYRMGQAVLDPGATLAFFERGTRLVQVHWETTPKPAAMRLVSIKEAKFPFLVDGPEGALKGLLLPGEEMKPKIAMHSHCSKGRSGAAARIPDRTSAWDKMRLWLVGWIMPAMDPVVRWLGRPESPIKPARGPNAAAPR